MKAFFNGRMIVFTEMSRVTMSLGTLLLHSALLSLINCCGAYKILVVFPIPSKSHAILGEGYVKLLNQAGHQITYITPMPMKSPPHGVRQIDVSETKKCLPVEEIFDTRSLMNQEIDLQDVTLMYRAAQVLANETINAKEVRKILRDPKEEFDAVIIEWLYSEMFAGFAAVFNCPLIWSSSMEAHSLVLSLIDEYPNPAYTFHHLSRDYGFNFWQRLHELWTTSNVYLFKWTYYNEENQMYKSLYENLVNKRGRSLPPYDDVRYNGSLVLCNSYVTTGEAISLPQNYKAVGGYHIEEDQQPLPKDLQKIMDDAKHGVIYFSMGSILRSDRIPEHLKKAIINVFAALSQTVIWKLEEAIPDLPKNVHILPWAPQTGILAHPNCVLFITHGGILSEIEAVHFGIPIIGIPLYGDQFLNINRAEYKGFAKRVDFYHDGPRKLNIAIREMIANPRYRELAKEYSFIHHDRPVPPKKELVHWVEHVVKTRGASHLRSPALQMLWYQKYYLDLIAIILALIFVIVNIYKQGLIAYRRRVKQKLV